MSTIVLICPTFTIQNVPIKSLVIFAPTCISAPFTIQNVPIKSTSQVISDAITMIYNTKCSY